MTVKLVISIQVSVPVFKQVCCEMFWLLLGYTVAKVCASPRNLTWLTRPFLLVRGWGLGTRLVQSSVVVKDGAHMYTVCRHINICCVQTDREGNFVKPLCSFVSQEFA